MQGKQLHLSHGIFRQQLVLDEKEKRILENESAQEERGRELSQKVNFFFIISHELHNLIGIMLFWKELQLEAKETLLNAKEQIFGQRELHQAEKEKIFSNWKAELDAKEYNSISW